MPRESLEHRYARCRAFQHSWSWSDPLGIDDSHPTISKPFGMSQGMIGFPAVCTNCGQQKVKWITRSGESITRREYPEGYQKSGDEALSPQEYRHEYVESIFASFEQNVTRLRPRKKSA